jgi:hypothetical protein
MAKKKSDDIPDPIMEFFVKLVLDQKFRDRFAKGSMRARRAMTKEVESFKLRTPDRGVLNALLRSDTFPVAVVLGPNQQTAPTNSDAILAALETALAERRKAKRTASKKR